MKFRPALPRPVTRIIIVGAIVSVYAVIYEAGPNGWRNRQGNQRRRDPRASIRLRDAFVILKIDLGLGREDPLVGQYRTLSELGD